MRESAGSPTPRLCVLRGNSGSGKTSIATEIRRRYGRGIALVSQDNIRRTVLRERDVPGAPNIGLIGTMARYALNHGYHVVIEGIMYADRYGGMLEALARDHQGQSRLYYLNVDFTETLRRHATKPQADEYGETEMRDWYRPDDLLPSGIEQVIPADSTLEESVARIMRDLGLADTHGHAPG
ncbi:AAA family ATPase [Kitasatospora kifunensis]|uniref:AAA family ATPase n=1 Tax=Kitasatospora kifunensis TaxID=58351 RepID=UPI001612F226|nr:AAA family ATPase [Kitasatospora kifunensis]